MITKLDIKNFKIHKSTTLELKSLNVLAGKIVAENHRLFKPCCFYVKAI